MLAVVKTPHTEISIHGDGSARILEYLKQQFQIEVLAADDDETLGKQRLLRELFLRDFV